MFVHSVVDPSILHSFSVSIAKTNMKGKTLLIRVRIEVTVMLNFNRLSYLTTFILSFILWYGVCCRKINFTFSSFSTRTDRSTWKLRRLGKTKQKSRQLRVSKWKASEKCSFISSRFNKKNRIMVLHHSWGNNKSIFEEFRFIGLEMLK